MLTITSFGPLTSPARVEEPTREPFRVGVVQQRWHAAPVAHLAALREGAVIAADLGAQLVCFQELTLSSYFAAVEPTDTPSRLAENIDDGPTRLFATQLASEIGVPVHASLFERSRDEDPLGFNTAIVVGADGALLARTRKLHIPITAGYYEDRYLSLIHI